jgi:hypothetical protein
MQSLSSIVLAFFFSVLPAQTREATKFVVAGSGDVCMGLSHEECCAQRLQFAGFKALGEHLPPRTEKPLMTSCEQTARKMTPGVCRTIAVARGFGAADLPSICMPKKIAKDCRKDRTCKQCSRDLTRLKYRTPENACRAVTYVPKDNSTKTVRIRSGIVVSRDGWEVTTRRYELE